MSLKNEKPIDQDQIWAKIFEPVKDTVLPQVRTRKAGGVKKNTSVDDSAERAKYYMQFLQEGSSVTQQYHHIVLEQTQQLIKVFTWVFALVTAFICAMVAYVIICQVDKANVLIPLIVTAVVDVISGILIVVLKLVSKTRDDFFKENLKAEYYSKIITLIKGVQDEEKQVELIRECINDYFGYIFKESTNAEYFDKIVGLVDSVKTETSKVALITPIVENYVKNKPGEETETPDSEAETGKPEAIISEVNVRV